jgi:hypothetical protein
MTAKYRDVVAEITGLTVQNHSAHVEGRFWFTLAPGVTARSACEEITRRGKQLALLIKSGQHVEQIAFRNGETWVPYRPSHRVTRACVAGVNDRFGLGEHVGDQWIGFELPPGLTITPETPGDDRMGYAFRFTLENFRTRFQVIPILHACLDLAIAQYHVVSAAVLRTTNPRVACSIDSTAQERSAS